MLYLYFAANADKFTLAVSPTAIRQEIGMARSTYHDQFHRLIDKGYLVPSGSSGYDFYEVPQTATQQLNNGTRGDKAVFAECASPDKEENPTVHHVLAEDREINNNQYETNTEAINKQLISAGNNMGIEVPKVKEVVIKPPVATGKNRPQSINNIKQQAFDF